MVLSPCSPLLPEGEGQGHGKPQPEQQGFGFASAQGSSKDREEQRKLLPLGAGDGEVCSDLGSVHTSRKLCCGTGVGTARGILQLFTEAFMLLETLKSKLRPSRDHVCSSPRDPWLRRPSPW